MSAAVPPTKAAPSPLAEIERTVQERAMDISLEMSAPDGEAKLRALTVAPRRRQRIVGVGG